MGGSTVFNGSTSVVLIADSSTLKPNSITISAWAKPSVINTSGNQTIARKWSTSGYILRFINGVPSFQAHNGGVVTASGPVVETKGIWKHYLGTYDATTGIANLYINAVLVKTTSSSPANLNCDTDALKIGLFTGEQFTGNIDDVRVFSSALTASQVASLYQTGANPVPPVGQWTLDDHPSTYVDTVAANNGTGTATTYSTDTPTKQRSSVLNINASASGSAQSPVGTFDVNTSQQSTVMFRVKTFSQTGQGIFGVFNSSGTLDAFRFNISATYPFIWATNTTAVGTGIYDSNSRTPNNEWVHYAVVYNTNGTTVTGKIYQNGKLLTQSTLTRDTRATSVFTLYSGSTHITTDVVAVLRELTISEIKDHCFNGLIPRNPKIAWERNEGTGNTNYDSSGGGNNGTGGTLTWSTDTPSKARKSVGGNLVPNGDFSFSPPLTAATTAAGGKVTDGTAGGSTVSAPQGLLFKWYSFISGTGAHKYDSDSTFSSSYKISTTAAASYVETFLTNSLGGASGYFSKSIPVLPNTSYSYSFWMKTNYVSGDSSDGAKISFTESLYDGTTASHQTNTSAIKTTTGWTKYSGTFTTTAGTRWLQVNPMIYGHTGAATLIMDAWFANIVITPTTNITRQSIT